ncbi:MAG: serine acetyltransferase [Deltaproteobacteria bacterium]|jgi:serine O-acetyltransferase|nr:serine acetyltransferase [Deltaproteobacteria bacterium]
MTDAPTDKAQKCSFRETEEEYRLTVVPALERAAQDLMEVRGSLRAYEHVACMPRPSFAGVKRILSLGRRLMFPGFFERRQPASELNVRYLASQQLSSLYSALSSEIAVAIRHDHMRRGGECVGCAERSRDIALEVCGSLSALRAVMASDVEATLEGDPAAGDQADQIIFSYPGIYATLAYRLAHVLWLRKIPFLPRMLTELAHGRTGIDIHPGARIGGSFFIDHGTGVVVGETTVIGERVRIYQGVTLGALSLPRDAGVRLRGEKRHPTLEDDVIVYSGATILGGETVIGARSVVGGNVWLTESIPPDTKIFIKKPELIIINNVKRTAKS